MSGHSKFNVERPTSNVERSQSEDYGSKPKICFVTGATGAVGLPLVQTLIENGHTVRVLVRKKAKPHLFPHLFPLGVEIVTGDLDDCAALERGTENAAWIFHLAAKLHINNPSLDLQKEYAETNVNGTARLLAAAKKQGAEKFVFFSTISVYGASDGKKIFDENDKINPQGFYAESKAATENLVLAQENTVVLRLAAVYGARMKGNFARLLIALRRNRFVLIGDGANRRTLIHQKDAARAALLAAERAPNNSIYNVSDGEINSFSRIITAMSQALDKKAPKLRLPLAPVKLGIGLVEDLSKILGIKSAVDRALLEKLLEDVAVSGAKIKSELGFCPEFDLTNGWRETVRSLASQ